MKILATIAVGIDVTLITAIKKNNGQLCALYAEDNARMPIFSLTWERRDGLQLTAVHGLN